MPAELKLFLRARENTLGERKSHHSEVRAIVRSHHRLTQKNFDPARGAGTRPLNAAELEKHRRESDLAALFPALERALQSGDDLHVSTMHDSAGWVLWRFGSVKALRISDSLRPFELKLELFEGACWREDTVGTNAAGTALIERCGLLCIAHEHYVASHHRFACAATPLYDAWDSRRLLGVLNVTTFKEKAHANTLTMVELAARLVPGQVRQALEDKLAPLREAALPTLHKLGTPAVLTDGCGHVLASQKIALKNHLLPPPTQMRDQPFDCPVLGGRWVIEPLGSGWLWRPVGEDSLPATRVELDVRQPMRWSLTVHRTGTSTPYDLSKRQPDDLAELLPFSTAPAIRRIREA